MFGCEVEDVQRAQGLGVREPAMGAASGRDLCSPRATGALAVVVVLFGGVRQALFCRCGSPLAFVNVCGFWLSRTSLFC